MIDEDAKMRIEGELAPKLWRKYGIRVFVHKNADEDSYRCMLYKGMGVLPKGELEVLAELVTAEYSDNRVSIRFGEWDTSPEDMPKGSEKVGIWSCTVDNEDDIEKYASVILKVDEEFWSKLIKHAKIMEERRREKRERLISYFKSL
ncbi:MAG: hypothetical protein DRP11_05095 [Candidatus Aenigmatarchaeota archaeon]|mgnify:CR=1 FL=1|nr:MAG: hypothetical protein DRP11_05095 [Candidatus Aenigmarchaeota archaeon]